MLYNPKECRKGKKVCSFFLLENSRPLSPRGPLDSLSTCLGTDSLRLTSIESVMPSSHLILCRTLLLLPPIPHSIRVFSSESTLRTRWPKYWTFSFSISPSKEHPGLISFRWTGWISLQSKGLSRVFSNTTLQKHHSSALTFLYSPTLTSIHDHRNNHSLD